MVPVSASRLSGPSSCLSAARYLRDGCHESVRRGASRACAIAVLCVTVASVLAVAELGDAGGRWGRDRSPTGSQASQVAIKQATPALRREVNVVCQTVRQGPRKGCGLRSSPVPSPASAVATRSAERTAVAQRLAAQGGGQGLRLVASGYVALRAVYSNASLAAHNARSAARLGQTIELRELAVTAASRSAGVPACGVAGR